MRSSKPHLQIDSGRERMITLYSITYRGPRGQGDVLATLGPDESWRPIAPGTVGEATFELACKRPER